MAGIAAERYTGASIKRSEDQRVLTGAGRYVDDIKLPRMLHAAFVRSPLAHARVLSVDVSAARALPGVAAALTGADLEAMTVPGPDTLATLMGGAGRPRRGRHRREPLRRRGRLRACGGGVCGAATGHECVLGSRSGQPAAICQSR
jgi:CO/xanthine dehydrogenase Mo-binding subunit